jgi:3-(3-hydroxy-phenyl)propionate hydroxylase
VLLSLGEAIDVHVTPWADRVRLIEAAYAGVWDLPVIGTVPPPSAVLVRPDGYVAWVGGPAAAGLPETLTTWFGSPS